MCRFLTHHVSPTFPVFQYHRAYHPTSGPGHGFSSITLHTDQCVDEGPCLGAVWVPTNLPVPQRTSQAHRFSSPGGTNLENFPLVTSYQPSVVVFEFPDEISFPHNRVRRIAYGHGCSGVEGGPRWSAYDVRFCRFTLPICCYDGFQFPEYIWIPRDPPRSTVVEDFRTPWLCVRCAWRQPFLVGMGVDGSGTVDVV